MTRNIELKSQNGYMIPCEYDIEEGDRAVCVICHGFASSKASSTAHMVSRMCRSAGVGFLTFDFPCHGESRAVFTGLTPKNCLDDLRTCELWAREQSKGGEIIYFGSSFGGYTVLGHLCTREHEGRLALLRSAAVNMDRVFDPFMEDIKNEMAEKGYFTYKSGFGPDLRLSPGFFESLRSFSPFDYDLPEGADVHMIHGARDTVVDFGQALKYSLRKNCPIDIMALSDHSIADRDGIKRLRELVSVMLEKVK